MALEKNDIGSISGVPGIEYVNIGDRILYQGKTYLVKAKTWVFHMEEGRGLVALPVIDVKKT